jgi:hypothetical protein
MERFRSTLKTLLIAGLTSILLLLGADPSSGQFATINFPDTVVGSSSTVKCPTTSVSLCFGSKSSLLRLRYRAKRERSEPSFFGSGSI